MKWILLAGGILGVVLLARGGAASPPISSPPSPPPPPRFHAGQAVSMRVPGEMLRWVGTVTEETTTGRFFDPTYTVMIADGRVFRDVPPGALEAA